MAGANPMRGEAEIGGHKLVVDFNAWCVAESATGFTMAQILGMMAKDQLGLREFRSLIRSFLAEEMPLNEVGNLIGEVGLGAASKALSSAIEGFFPAAKEKAANPQPAK